MKPDIKGLMKLGRFLQRLPKKNFRQNTWFEKVSSKNPNECGTEGCVAGWAATLFPSRFKRVYTDTIESSDPSTWEVTSTRKLYDVVHRSSGAEGSEAFAMGFRISQMDADRITDGDAHRKSPRIAARSIFSLVNRLKRQMKAAK